MTYLIIFLSFTFSKIVIVDDIGLSQNELKKLKDMKGSYIKDKIRKLDNVLEFPKDFINQKGNKGEDQNGGFVNKADDTESKRPTNSMQHANKDKANYNSVPDKNNRNTPYSYNNNDDENLMNNKKNTPNDMYSNDNKNERNNNGDFIFDPNKGNSTYDFSRNNRMYDPDKYQSKQYDPPSKNRDELLSNQQRFESPSLNETLSNEKNLVRQEKENIIDANRARTSLIDLKLNESKQRQTEIERTINELSIKHETILQKLKQRKDEQEQINMDVITLKNRKSNLNNSKRRIELDRDKIEASLRLIGNEIAHLNKQLDDLKTKSITVKDEKQVYDNRLRQHEEDLSDVTKRLNGEEMRQTEYLKEVNGLETINLSLKGQLEDLKIKKAEKIVCKIG